MSGTTVPAALDALAAVCRTALPAGFQVTDGPDYDPRLGFLAVGWHSNDEPAVTESTVIADLGLRHDQENYDIHSLLSLHVGSETVSSVRADLYASFELISTAIAADRDLGGAVHRARIVQHEYLPMVDEGGVTVSIRFAVNVIAWK
jgi:hypothetical protein